MVASGKLSARTVKVADLPNHLKSEMFKLFARFYDDVSSAQFMTDLADKNEVILAFDSGNKNLQGFSTIKIYDFQLDNQEVKVMFSGETTMHRAFFNFVVRTKMRHPLTPFYWFLISKGYKTYLSLARNVPKHWPRHDERTPQFDARLLDRLASERFGKAWHADLGLLKFDRCMGRLKAGVAPIDIQLLNNPQIRFFQEKNPQHQEGDELCCLGKINWQVFTHFIAKMAEKNLARVFLKHQREVYGRIVDRPS